MQRIVRKLLARENKSQDDLPIKSPQTQVSLKNEALEFWNVYLDFAYYLSLLPFRFKFNISTRTYDLVESRGHRVCSTAPYLLRIKNLANWICMYLYYICIYC
jgi:hypothetical protein